MYKANAPASVQGKALTYGALAKLLARFVDSFPLASLLHARFTLCLFRITVHITRYTVPLLPAASDSHQHAASHAEASWGLKLPVKLL